MEWYFLAIIIILGLLAVTDLTVGVANDAVNFLSPAVGSRAASFRLIIIIASAGVIIGSLFSGGMMEVARKGIFNPEQFVFSEIIIIFLAVMIADVLLLDFFNTFGLPTSTTVSIVFDLLGAAVAVSIIKIIKPHHSVSELGNYINTEKALAIISGILISVVVAFIVGLVVQYIVRLIYTFNYQKNVKYTSGIFGGVALTAILLFIMLKGLHDTSFIAKSAKTWISDNTVLIVFCSFIILSILLQLLHWLFKLNVFKLVVLAGTFGLALSFAGNDLVNFIGAPMAGYKSYQLWQASGENPDTYNMIGLKGDVPTDIYFLLIAGLIMVVTIFLSRKARTVVQTTVQLSRQGEGNERWGSSIMARTIVQSSVTMQKGLGAFLPKAVFTFLGKRFEKPNYNNVNNEENSQASFDLIRASVNLVVASILIASATSLKLPLSTTYVTFMVAMGTSLADGAWGRESAVYRITGVLTVISGWFFTALIAFIAAAVVAFILYFGGIFGVIAMVILSVVLLYRTKIMHKKNENTEKDEVEAFLPQTSKELSELTNEQSMLIISKIPEIYSETIDALEDENRKLLKKLSKDITSMNKQTKKLKTRAINTFKNLSKELFVSGTHSIQIYDYVRETEYCLNYITIPAFTHVNNVHNPIPSEQFNELKLIKKQVKELFAFVIEQINNKTIEVSVIQQRINNIVMFIDSHRKVQLKNIKDSEINTRTTILYLGIMHETKNMLLHLENFVKVYNDFLNQLPK